MPQKLNVGVIGVGNMGRHHARVYSELSGVNLVAVCDTNKERGKEVAAQHHCVFYANYQKMLSEQKIDAVSIVVPTFLHHKVARDVLEKNVHVLLEKPIAASVKEGREIINMAKERKVILTIGHIERFNPAIDKLQELIKLNQLGEIFSLNIKRLGMPPPHPNDANVIVDLATHDIDISNYLLEEYPLHVQGYKSKSALGGQEDGAAILLKYKRAVVFLEVSWAAPVKVRTLEVMGAKALVTVDYIQQTIILCKHAIPYLFNHKYKNFGEFTGNVSHEEKTVFAVQKEEPLRRELESFIESIVHNRKLYVSSEDALRALQIALKI